MKSEQSIFQELEILASDVGFIELLALLTFKDTYIVVDSEELDSKSFIKSYDRTRLSKTELATLVALTVKNYSGNDLLSSEQLSKKAIEIYELFEELHQTFFPMQELNEQVFNENFFSSGSVIRESIFYSAESAFKHQYKDISQIRYQPDNEWLKLNKGFTIEELVLVVSSIAEIQLRKVNELLSSNVGKQIESFLPAFEFNLDELVRESKLPVDLVKFCLNPLVCHSKDKGLNTFKSVDDFNYTNACPIIQIDESYYTFSTQVLWESIYESPFFWFKDTSYNDQASENRGIFTEHFTATKLATIFGCENVFTNIDMFKGNNKAGEVDVLVIFGGLALVIQAKSKKLTIAARKGNSQQIEKDFQGAVEHAYSQALDCSRLLQEEGTVFKDENGNVIEFSRKYKTILPVCVVSDHYPALAAQARQFLKYEVDDIIKYPFVTDVFFIDTLTEMLPSPLHIVDYLIKRGDYGNSVIVNHELSTLAVYINQNLSFQDEFKMIMLDDNVVCDLELAMMARREGLEDVPLTPDGLLTRFKDSYVGRLLDQVSFSKVYKLQQVGLHLLSLDEQSINFINEAIENIQKKYFIDHKNHDLTMSISASYSGLTIHCNTDAYEIAYPRLKKHIERRKYSQKAQSWVGFCINPHDLKIAITIYEDYAWTYSPSLQALVEKLDLNGTKKTINPRNSISIKPEFSEPVRNIQAKIGRNEPCPCGSGSKFKKCCGA